jgi:hypothetical protein
MEESQADRGLDDVGDRPEYDVGAMQFNAWETEIHSVRSAPN